MTTGSLGHGLSAAVGMALANKLDGFDGTIYVIIGDGECNEGQVWEAAMAAAHYHLDNIIAFLDYNKMGLDGYMDEVMDISDITSKWVAFNWAVHRVDGHDFEQLDRVIIKAKAERNRPSMIVLDTIKGKDCIFAEGRVESHHMAVNREMATQAITYLDQLEI
jgi:transketolase